MTFDPDYMPMGHPPESCLDGDYVFPDDAPKHPSTIIGPTMAKYFRRVYAGRCPHIFYRPDGVCMKHRCLARRKWIREYKNTYRIQLGVSELRRNVHVLNVIEGFKFK